ncbi:MAG: virB8 family protein [Thermaurantiacus sp.]
MTMQPPDDLETYYRDAASWDRDRESALQSQRRLAWIVAGIALAVALLLALALFVLMPLKRVELVTVLVDRQTGFAQAVDPMQPERLSADAALTQSLLAQYVIAREGFDIDTLQANYRKVAIWSGETARSSYIARMQAGSPESPLSRYPRSTTVAVSVKSVTALGPNVGMVRFETVRRDQGADVEPPRDYVAVIRYRYSGEPLAFEDRLVNPLGFQVLRYQRNQETVPESSPQGLVDETRPVPRQGPLTGADVLP